MFVKAIRVKDVRSGDVVCEVIGENHEIVVCERDPQATYPTHILYPRTGGVLRGHPDQIIGLVHRPWLRGQLEEDMLRRIRDLSAGVAKASNDQFPFLMYQLQIAIEAYELGKPFEEKSSLKQKPHPKEFFRD